MMASRRKWKVCDGRASALVALVLALAAVSVHAAPAAGEERLIPLLRIQLRPLEVGTNNTPGAEAAAYRSFYGFDIDPGVSHAVGTFKSGNASLAGQVFSPSAGSNGTVILVHGYLDHSATWRHLVKALLDRGFTVAMYDMKGHGLSSGARADIDSFDTYIEEFRNFLAFCKANLPGPYHAVGHSTGAAAIAGALLVEPVADVDRVVLIAPIVRSKLWYFTEAAYATGGRITAQVPRKIRRNSGDPEFIEFMKRDPLQCRVITARWYSALRDWNNRWGGFAESVRPVKVMQGTADATIDWKYSLQQVRSKFPQADVVEITDGRHQLMNEAEPMRSEVISSIVACLLE